jgi:putative transposase
MVVDEESRLPLARPWLTLAVDIPTRLVLGFYLSLDAPSSLSVALVVTHSVLNKASWLADRDPTLSWPASGIPDWIETDNGEEFHSKAFERGAAEYGIRLTYRPPGSPEVGGHIERLIGNFMHCIHLIPGTTFSNVADKGDYDSEARAVMSLGELERWLALQILGQYHKDKHSALQAPPELRWDRQLRARPSPIRQALDPERFLFDFLPGEKRMIRRDGVRIFNIHYWDNVLSPIAGRSNKPYLIKYDPRDLSRVYVQANDGSYWSIGYRDLGAPPITLWEHRIALQRLREHGRNSVDESTVFRTILEQLALICSA